MDSRMEVNDVANNAKQTNEQTKNHRFRMRYLVFTVCGQTAGDSEA